MSKKLEDCIRTNMITHFHCAECGAQLKLTYDVFSNGEKHSEQEPEEPTGAKCFYTGDVFIYPCESCINKYTGPAKKIFEGLKGMEGI